MKSPKLWIATLLFTIVTVSAYSGTVYASLFSFLAPLIQGEPVSAQAIATKPSKNLQTLALLQSATNIDPNPNKPIDIVPIEGGEILVADIASTNDTSSEYNTSISTYTVRSGDTVSGVAHMFNVSINTLMWANDLSSKSILKPGQNLIILPVSGISYEIKKGDTIGTIAKRFNADQNDILNYNDITVSALVVGQKIIIPDAELSTVQVASLQSGAKTSQLTPSFNYPNIANYYIRPIVGGHKSQGIHGHNGVDLAAPVGTPIIASAAGTVIISRSNGAWNGGYGNYVVISHPNGTQTLYAHMLRTTVRVGEKVDQGQSLGFIGMTGKTTGPHIHFEIRGARNPF